MTIKSFACLVVALLVSSTSSWHGIESAAKEGFRFDAAELKDPKRWTQVNAQPYHISTALDGLCAIATPEHYKVLRERTGNIHSSDSIIVYVNKVGRQAMFAKQPRFPEGSIIVKQKLGVYVPSREPLLYTLMRKRGPGYNPDVGDWEFLVVSGNGKELQASGRLQNCQTCHVGKKDSDFVFRPYVKFD